MASQLQHTLEAVSRTWLVAAIIWEETFWGAALLMACVSTVGLYLIFMSLEEREREAVDILVLAPLDSHL